MQSTCKAAGWVGLLLGTVLLAAPATSVSAQQTQDSSGIGSTFMDPTGYPDSLVRPGYRALLEDTTVGFAGESSGDSNPIPFLGDIVGQTGMGGGMIDTTAIPGRRNEDSTAVRSEQ